MNRSDIFSADQIHHGFGKFDDIGVGVNYDLYDINVEKANKAHLQICNHCGRGLNPARTYLAIRDYHQASIQIDVSREQLDQYRNSDGRPKWWIAFLGSECAKQVPAKFRVLLSEMPDWWKDDVMMTDEVMWGTY